MRPSDTSAAGLGYPWDRLLDAEAAIDEAKRFAALALEAGTDADRRKAELDLDLARDRWHAARDDAARVWLFMFDQAARYFPEALFAKLMAFAVAQDWRDGVRRFMAGQAGSAEHLLGEFAGIKARLKALEAAVAEMEAGCVVG